MRRHHAASASTGRRAQCRRRAQRVRREVDLVLRSVHLLLAPLIYDKFIQFCHWCACWRWPWPIWARADDCRCWYYPSHWWMNWSPMVTLRGWLSHTALILHNRINIHTWVCIVDRADKIIESKVLRCDNQHRTVNDWWMT